MCHDKELKAHMLRKHVVLWAVALCVGLLSYTAPTPVSAAIIEPWTDQNQGLTHVQIPDDVTEIGMGAYADNHLRSVVIPPSVGNIRAWAFENNELKLVVIEGAATSIHNDAFAHHSDIIVVGHPGSPAQTFASNRGFTFVPLDNYHADADGLHYAIVDDLADVIFYDRLSLNVVIPEEVDGFPVVGIFSEVFKDSGLTSVVLPESLQSVGRAAFMNNALPHVTIPDTVTTIGDWAFQHNLLRTIQFGTGLTEIGMGVFANNQLAFLEVPGHVQHIGDWAFENTPIRELRLSDGVRSVGRGAFNNSLIRKLRLPQSVEQLDELAFANHRLETIIVERYDIQLGDASFGKLPGYPVDPIMIGEPGGEAEAYANANAFEFAEHLMIGDYSYIERASDTARIVDFVGHAGGELTIPAKLGGSVVRTIGASAFAYRSLTGVELPPSVQVIGYGAFQSNPIKRVNFSDELKSIGESAFLGNALYKVMLPASVEEIGQWSFLYNPMRLVIVEGETIIGHDALQLIGDQSLLTIAASAESPAEDYAMQQGSLFRVLQSDGEFYYYEHETGEAMIYEYAGVGGAVHIPDTWNGLDVTAIDHYTFELKDVTSVKLPARLAAIGESAFRYNHLTEVALGPELKVIAKEAFLNNKITHLRIPASVEEIGQWAFVFNPLQQIIMERLDTSIVNNAFMLSGDDEAADRVILSGHIGSTAETYADVHGHTFYDVAITPDAVFSPDGMAWSRLVDTAAAVDVAHGGLLHYLWSNDEAPPAWGTSAGWTEFTSGDEVSLPVDSGEWYMHVHVADALERPFFLRSEPYRIDRIAPGIRLEAAITLPTNQAVTVTADVYDVHSGIAVKKWMLGEADKDVILLEGLELHDSFAAEHDGVYSVYAQDAAGNETLTSITISNIDRVKPVVTLIGSPVVTIPIGAPFLDPGLTATDDKDGILTAFVSVTGHVDSSEAGVYTLIYQVTDAVGNTSDPVQRLVHVVESDESLAIFPSLSPIGQTNGAVTVTAAVYATNGLDVMKYMLEDAQLADFAAGGTLWDSSPIVLNENGWISLYAKDLTGLEVIEKRQIANIDRVKPVITLNGSVTIILEQGQAFSDPGAAAIDDVDGNITGLITVSGSVNQAAAGTYTLQYDAADRAGNAADPVTRTVQVIAASEPDEPEDSESSDSEEESSSDSDAEDEFETGTITQQGGVIEVLGVVFQVPESAVEQSVTIRVEMVSDDALPSLEQIYSSVYEITKDVPGLFAERIRVELPFEVAPEELDASGMRLTLAWLDEQTGEWIELEQVEVDWEARTVSGETDHFTKFAVIAVAAEEAAAVEIELEVPADVAGHWAEPYIMQLMQLGLASGYPDGQYKPDRPITRAEFIALVARVLHLEPSGERRFADTAGHWAEAIISAAAARQWISGYADGTFRPNAQITREETAAIIARAFGLSSGTRERSFADDAAISGWANAAVQAAAESGIITGDTSGQFRPKSNTTRAEAATVIAKWLHKSDEEGRLTR